MCQNCKTSELGIERQMVLDEAIKQCAALDINPAIGGFIARYQHPQKRSLFTSEQQQALSKYNDAFAAMKKLHDDYVWGGMRQAYQTYLLAEYTELMRSASQAGLTFEGTNETGYVLVQQTGEHK